MNEIQALLNEAIDIIDNSDAIDEYTAISTARHKIALALLKLENKEII